jgi:TrmH family RNA methyltransferase
MGDAMRQTALISSTSNPRVQRARRLKRKADRDAAGAFLIESLMTLEAATEAGIDVAETFVDADAASVIDRCEALGLAVTRVSAHVLRALADTSTPQDLVAVAAKRSRSLDDLDREASLIVVLAEVRDPGNAGTLVRSAAAAGADAVIFTAASVDPYAPKTVRSSAGALFALPIVDEIPLGDCLVEFAARGLTVYLAEAGEGPALPEVDLRRPLAFVLGNEARGIPRHDIVAHSVSIPMPGGTESLNVAIAGSILLYEAVRQRRDTRG